MTLRLKDYLKHEIDRGEIWEDEKERLVGKDPVTGDFRIYFYNYLDRIGYITMDDQDEVRTVFIYPAREGARRVLNGID